MKVFKFGGASVKNAGGIRNLGRIVSAEQGELIIVVSAFGKTTNALEEVLKLWLSDDQRYVNRLDEIWSYHDSIISELFEAPAEAKGKNDSLFSDLKDRLQQGDHLSYDADYDQIVSFGELWSTTIVAEYLGRLTGSVSWTDIRNILITDLRFRDANILWDESSGRARSAFDFTRNRIYITQGFIGGTLSGLTTTLGREGSDYTAALLGNMLDADNVVFWKDVPGILNADPKWLPGAGRLQEISYKEAVEMTFSGAKVIHPKTIKPLHNKNIQLHVRSFLDPSAEGTVIKADAVLREVMPVFIKKEDQILISFLPRDFSFVMGDNLSRIFHTFTVHGIKVNLVEASAVSLDVCLDDERPRIDALINDLKTEFSAVYNEGVEMLSIRHYTDESISLITSGREILLEQRTRSTVRFVMRKL